MRTTPRKLGNASLSFTIASAALIAATVLMCANPADASPRGGVSIQPVAGQELGSSR